MDFVPLAAGRAHGLVVGRHGPGAVHWRCKASSLLNLEMLCTPVRKPLNCSPPAHSLVDVKQLILSMYLRQSLLSSLLSLALRNVLFSILQECLTHLSRRHIIICILGYNRLRQLERLEVLAVHWVALKGRLGAQTLVHVRRSQALVSAPMRIPIHVELLLIQMLPLLFINVLSTVGTSSWSDEVIFSHLGIGQ